MSPPPPLITPSHSYCLICLRARILSRIYYLLFIYSDIKTQFLWYYIFAQCFPSMHCKQTWHKDCLHCVISQTLSFSYVFCIKVTLTHDKNSSNISHLRTVVLSTMITSLLKNMMILRILFEKKNCCLQSANKKVHNTVQ